MAHDEQRDPVELLRSIKRWLYVLAAATALLFVVLIAGAAWSISTSAKTHDALCTFRDDLQTRVYQTERFIAHPEQFPGVKIDPKLLTPQLESQKRTIIALEGLGCGPLPKPPPPASIVRVLN